MAEKEAFDNKSPEHPDSETEDFASLFEASRSKIDTRVFRDQKIEGTIVSIRDDWAFVDIGYKSEAVIAREELLDKNGELKYGVGDSITAYVINKGDDIVLSIKMTAAASEQAIKDAKDAGLPVEGIVSGERKGGYTVTVFGKQAFCPFSQIDIHPGGLPSDYIGQKFTFRIMEYSDRGRNIVLSRRDILEEERAVKTEELKKTLKPGDIVQGIVRKITNFGAFVDIGGVEGLVPISELAWHRIAQVSDIVDAGEHLTVKVLDLDWPANRISLSLKQVGDDPWTTAVSKFPENSLLAGTVTRLMNFGAFVELEPGIEGLIHISNLGTGRRINHPKEVVHEGDRVEVKVLSVDPATKRIGLELQHHETDSDDPIPQIHAGDVVTGTVDSIKEYGIFIALPGRRSGLLHVSEIDDKRKSDLRNRFPLGSTITAEVIAIDEEGKKISLSLKSMEKRSESAQFKEYASDKGSGSFGTFGDLLKNKTK